MAEGTCGSCKHWQPIAEDSGSFDSEAPSLRDEGGDRVYDDEMEEIPAGGSWGYCGRVAVFGPQVASRFYVVDGSEYLAKLGTRDDFGCVEHERGDEGVEAGGTSDGVALAGPFSTKLTVRVTPDFDPDAWHGRIISEDDGPTAPPDLDGSLVLAEGETPDRWDGTVAAVLALADGTFASYKTFYGPTGTGFSEDAYGGDADLHVGSLAWVVTFGLTDEGRGLCGIPAGGIETWCRQVTARLEAQRG